LTASLSTSPLDPAVIWEAMRDKVHQPQREGLVRLRSHSDFRERGAKGGPSPSGRQAGSSLARRLS